jgi:2-oxoglutarate dehydrogenase E2 component (dihydrolipoamide succinyltransferase)
MKVEIKVPPMGESITEATIANIIKPSGSKVAMDDEILELETDKVNQVLYAPQAGVITFNINPNDKVKIGQVLGFVDSEAAEKKLSAPEQPATPKPEQPSPSKPEEPTPPKPEKPTPSKPEQPSVPKPEQPVQPKPTSTARYGKEEFLQDLQQPSPKTSAPAVPVNQRETRYKMSNIRRVIASRMVEVKNTTAMLTTFNEVDMSQVIAMREKYKDVFLKKYDVKLGFMSFFVKACVSALQQFPEINSYIDGEDIVHREFYDIGIAVGTDRGVIVPVIRNCDQLSYAEIESSIEQFAKKAREGTLTVNDLQGGSFTITNGGIYGSMLSTPIINPNQCAILGLHKITKRPVAIDDQVTIRPIMYLALSYDHRIIDGKEAVSFLAYIKNDLEFFGSALLGL